MQINHDRLQKVAHQIRGIAADMVEKAQSGHPGLPMGCAELGVLLWAHVMSYNPAEPLWLNRDRFILSAGHGSAWLYTCLHLAGYEYSLENLKQFRQMGSITPGHPEYAPLRGVETTTGPLGQGFANAVGQAIAAKYLCARFPELFDYRIYVLAGDGDMMEGITYEAASLAGHLALNNLIVVYDDNHITIDGNTAMTFTEDVGTRFKAFGWNVIDASTDNVEELLEALQTARREEIRPALIRMRSLIGQGSPHKEGTSACHGAPLGQEELRLTKMNLGLDPERAFQLDRDSYRYFQEYHQCITTRYQEWQDRFRDFYRVPENQLRWEDFFAWQLPADYINQLKATKSGKARATRDMNAVIMQTVAELYPNFIGGSADLGSSTKTVIKNSGSFDKTNRLGKNIHFGVREHAMAGIANGLAQMPGLWPFVSTFFVFSDYLRPSLRLSSLMQVSVVYIFTHDSFYVGEDGPTHQPIEHLDAISLIPGLTILRPGNEDELIASWQWMLEHRHQPVCLLLTRQKIEVTESSATEEMFARGIYLFDGDSSANKPDLRIFGSGSELSKAVSIARALRSEEFTVDVYSAPSLSFFKEQEEIYRRSVFPGDDTPVVVIEAASGQRWQRYLGPNDLLINIDHFGHSAPCDSLEEYWEFTHEHILKKIKEKVKKC